MFNYSDENAPSPGIPLLEDLVLHSLSNVTQDVLMTVL